MSVRLWPELALDYVYLPTHLPIYLPSPPSPHVSPVVARLPRAAAALGRRGRPVIEFANSRLVESSSRTAWRSSKTR